MPVVFSRNTGRVIAISDGVAAGSLSMASITSDPITFDTHKTIISRVGLSVAGNYQFLHAIGQDVYLYVFGDRMGQIVLHGTCFEAGCSGEGAGAAEPHGFEILYAWYLKNRIAANPNPIAVTIGRKTAFNGFVTGLNGDVQDPVFRTISFQMQLATLPDGPKSQQASESIYAEGDRGRIFL